jgi:hypothetical protein
MAKKNKGTKFQTSIELEDEYRDRVTGYTGKAVGVHFFLTGCTQISLESEAKDGIEAPTVLAFDETRLEDIEPADKSPGGPQRSVPRG